MMVHNPAEKITDAKVALQLLKEGNARYVANANMPRDTYAKDRDILSEGQSPFAVVICCSDSRIAPEIFFDQKLGDIFVIRNAGNVADTIALGSLEYAVDHLGTPLVVVCGHSCCGAVTAACSGEKLPTNIQAIAQYIEPAISHGGDVDTVIHQHVMEMAASIQKDEIVQKRHTRVCAAYYDIHTGVVQWLSELD